MHRKNGLEIELLAPAGGVQSARAALLAGANAVYLGLTEFSAREGAENFGLSALRETADFAHLLGAKVYVCFNTLVKDGETDEFFSQVKNAWEAGADALLVQDIFLGKVLHEKYPELVLHLSTQGGCNNAWGAELAKEYGFSRVVLARETPLAEISAISEIIETEAFVQGALCSCFSGQCYFSSFAGNNSGNRGRCKQPCRKRYKIDRAGCADYAYALSTSDLCVGEDVKKYLEAGVTSLKIEGRMRRPEYVAAAVGYYRALLDGAPSQEAFSRLKRAYNRGDYTRGLAFGQKEDFLSRNVQGHIGERVGTLSFSGGKPFCKSEYKAQNGDGFKLLRGGYEVGGAVFGGTGAGGFFLRSADSLKAGDEVRVTTDTAGNAALLSAQRKRELRVTVRIAADGYPLATCGAYSYTGEQKAERAQRAPLTKEEIVSCFSKTDGLPLSPCVTAETEGAFLPKSALNAFRRAFYAGLASHLCGERKPLAAAEFSAEVTPKRGELTAVITGDAAGAAADIVVYKPADYSNFTLPKRGGKKYLYLPPLFSRADERLVAERIGEFDGIYCDSYYAIVLAKKYHKPLFAGTGFNLTNKFAVEGVRRAGAEYFVLSHELSTREQNSLSAEGAFALTAGGVKVMELCYCPFGRTCTPCDKREFYTLTDEDGRTFPLRRYALGSGCRFEVYNCAPLRCERGTPSALVDDAAEKPLTGVSPTRGHSNRSML